MSVGARALGLASGEDALAQRDPALIGKMLPLMHRVNRHYLRLVTEGFESVPRSEPVLYVGNHNGGIAGPDLCATLASLWQARGPEAPLYMLAHDFAMRQLPRVGGLLGRLGAVRAHPENARAALQRGAQVLVYPGGDLDAYRLGRRRDEVVLGQRTGFVRVAQAAGVRIVPIVAHGAHRSAYIFSEGKRIAQALSMRRWARLERFPLALALPWGLALGPWVPYLPLPFQVRLRVLPPIEAPQSADPHDVRERVRSAMQVALRELATRSRPQR